MNDIGSDGIDPGTPPQDIGAADQVEHDPAEPSSSEDFDEDRLRADPLEEGMDAPEHWAGANRYGTTPSEERHGESLDDRLAEEVPDVDAEQDARQAGAATPIDQLDETIDDRAPDEAVLDEDDLLRHRRDTEQPPPEVRRGQSADDDGGAQ